MNGDGQGELQECGTGSEYGSGSEETAALLSRPSVTPLVVAPQAVVVLGGASSSSSGSVNSAANQPVNNPNPGGGGGGGGSGSAGGSGAVAGRTSTSSSSTGQSNKPVLQRQDRATYLVASPQLSVSGLGGSEESGTGIEDPATRSVPDIELQCRLDEHPIAAGHHAAVMPTAYQAAHYRPRQSHPMHRCRCDRRDSLAPSSALHLARSVSRESVRSGGHHCCPCQASLSSATIIGTYGVGGSGGNLPPPLLVTTSPTARMIRQSSQPEAASVVGGVGVGGVGSISVGANCCCCCASCSCPLHTTGGVTVTPSAASLRQLREPGDGIAGIAADSLRINGGIRQFRQYPWWCKSSPMTSTATTPPPPLSSQQQQQQQQAGGSASGSSGGGGSQTGGGGQGGQGVLLCPRTLAQARRSRLRRALTEATAETVNYVKAAANSFASTSHAL